jgi:hypothetical protein
MLLRTTIPALLTVFALGGCAGAPATQESGLPAPDVAPTATVEVLHNIRTAMSLTVHLVMPSGVHRRLGNVPAVGVHTFEDSAPVGAGEFRLIGETTDGRRIVSPPFQLGPQGVRWDLDANRVVPLSFGR